MPKEEHVCRVSLGMPKVECGGRLLCARGFAVVSRVGHARALRSVWRSTWSSGLRGSVMWACNVASVHGAVCHGHKDGAALFVRSGSCLGRCGPCGSRLSRAIFVDGGRHCCAIFFCFFARFCHVSEHAKNDRFALCRVPFLARVRDRFLGASEVTFGTSFW